MKKKIQLPLIIAFLALAAHAQKKQQRTTAYAITAADKGGSGWSEVRLVDLATGEEVQSVYKKDQEVPVLNARTGKAIVKKEMATNTEKPAQVMVYRSNSNVNNNNNNNINNNISTTTATSPRNYTFTKTIRYASVNSDKPFATNSAACAYDKKHDRLFYTPMNINQLRYIDLRSDQPKIGYFEDEPFGALSGRGDVDNQITRMVFASDGNGYALTNNAEHLIRFTSKKKIDKTEVTDLGALIDDGSNGSYSIRSRNGYGGDMIADESGNLYLITANRAVFKINIETKVATYLGVIKGLPRGYSTNGASVEKETSVIVSSANAVSGYYKFDLKTMQAEKYSTGENVYNASDLANGNLISEKKKKKDEVKVEEIKNEEPVVTSVVAKPIIKDQPTDVAQSKMSVYPNPVSADAVVHIAFNDCPQGRYNVQLIDLSGQVLSSQSITIGSKSQIHDLRLPKLAAKGSYLVKLISEFDKVVSTERIVVQ